jgi:hypothetical protein
MRALRRVAFMSARGAEENTVSFLLIVSGEDD